MIIAITLMIGACIGIMIIALVNANREDDGMNITIEEYELSEDDLIEAVETIKEYCKRGCKNCAYCNSCPLWKIVIK